MGLRNLLGCSLAVLLLTCAEASYRRQRRQVPETVFYQPPLLSNAPQPVPIPLQNSYQPPIPRPQQSVNNFEYRSPLEFSSSGQHQTIQYYPHDTSHSFSVHQQQPSPSERTSKVVESSASVQTIHKAPASEIDSKKDPGAKEKDAAKDEYVVYYYYYYDNDTTANANNLSSSPNFDDIPSLESYDETKVPEKIQPNLGNALDDSRNISSQARSISSQPSDAIIRADRSQPLKPVSNVFRYGSNEVPRFPVLPNFVVSEVSTTSTTEGPSPQPLVTSDSPTTTHSSPVVEEDDAVNSVLDTADLKEAKAVELEETTTTTTTEAPTTTEEETTTTERPSRRRPSLGGSRRRFNPSPASPPPRDISRSRNPPSRSSTSTSSTSTTTTVAPTRRTFQGSNRLRSRPSLGGSSRSRSESDTVTRSTTEATPSSSTTSRSRFSSAAPRRFQSSRSRSQSSSSTTSSTSTTTRSPSPSRSRPTSRPRPNLISRNRPPRPGFPRSRTEEVVETTTPVPTELEETSPANEAAVVSPAAAEDEESEENEESSEEEEESEETPTTTEGSRFSALFKPRNRNALNRPRPVIGNRPSRS